MSRDTQYDTASQQNTFNNSKGVLQTIFKQKRTKLSFCANMILATPTVLGCLHADKYHNTKNIHKIKVHQILVSVHHWNGFHGQLN